MATDTSTSTDSGTTTDDGKDDTGKNGADTATTTGTDTSTDDDDALTAENAAKWREMARKHEKQNGKLAAELDKIKADKLTDEEKAIQKARAEGRAEARAEALADMVTTTLEAAAESKLADPTFVRLLTEEDREAFVTKDGKVDKKAIASALDGLVKRHPTIAKDAKAGALPGGGKKPATGFNMNDEIRRKAGR